jgi:hypothetical protein
MPKDKFLTHYVEADGLKTLELVEAHVRNNMQGLTPEKTAESEDKESKRNVGGRPDKPEDIVVTYEFEENDLMVDTPPNFKLKDSHFEQA